MIEDLLCEEEQAGPIKAHTELAAHRERRAALAELFEKLHGSVNALQSRFNNLPRLAEAKHLRWAEAVSKFPNASVLILDTTGVSDESDIIRVLIADLHAESWPTHNWLVRPVRQPGYANTSYTGINREELLQAPTLVEIWGKISEALAGRYILSYNLKFARERLRENASNYDLEPVTVIGDCLMERAVNYFNSYQSLKLTDVSAKIGHTMPHPATALDRAVAQMKFLAAMREGILDLNYRPPTPVTSKADTDDFLSDDSISDLDHPF
jgi:DNA polymerase III epsilon subunit-like protein